MIIGHFGAALLAKRASPSPSLGAYFLACQLPDLACYLLMILGIERVLVAPGATATVPFLFESYPFSHSLLGGAALAVLMAGAYRAASGQREGAWALGAAVLSHWLLDAAVHGPDLPLHPGGALRVGAGLWGAPWAAFLLEGALFAAGAWLYAAGRGGAGLSRPQGALLAVLLLAHCAGYWILLRWNRAGGVPPLTPPVLALAGLLLALPAAWAHAVDRRAR